MADVPGIIAKFKITKSGESGIMVFTRLPQPFWYMESPVKWFPEHGTWSTNRNATKFRQWYQVRLLNTSGDYVAEWGPPPYRLHDKWEATMMDHSWFIQYDTSEKFDVEVVQTSSASKVFKIREVLDLVFSYGVGQKEIATFEIQDPATGTSVLYKYSAWGIGLSVPIPKVPVGGGASSAGPWNEFKAPGYMGPGDFVGSASMQTPANVGMGTSISYNIFDLHASSDGFEFDIHIPNFSTGSTFSLPSTGVTSGDFALAPPPQRRPPLGGYGKFGNAGR
jgi:hypothetical protein